MRYFLDGYNFIFRLGGDGGENLKKSRELFIRALAFKNRRRGLDITLFFDARKEEPFSSFTQLEGIQVLFCSSYRSADEAILDELSRSNNPKEITVVSGDKPLLASSASLGAKTLSPALFLALLSKKGKTRKISPSPPIIKKEEKEDEAPTEEPRSFDSLEEYYLFHFQKEGGQTGIPIKGDKLHKKEDEIESEFLRWLRLFSKPPRD